MCCILKAFAFENWTPKRENFPALHNLLGCSGKRNERVSWRKVINNHLGSLISASGQNNCFSVNSKNIPVIFFLIQEGGGIFKYKSPYLQ